MRVEATLGCALLGAASVHAQLVIDDFTSGPANYTVSSGLSYFTQNGSMLGGTRTEGLNIASNPGGLPFTVAISGGVASFTQPANMTVSTAIGYGYNASADHSTYSTFDLALNLGSLNTFSVTVGSAQVADNASIELNDNPSEEVGFTIASSSTPQTYNVSFGSAGFSGVDFTNIHQIALNFDPINFDITEFIRFTVTPEPMPFALLGMGVVGLMARRRMKR